MHQKKQKRDWKTIMWYLEKDSKLSWNIFKYNKQKLCTEMHDILFLIVNKVRYISRIQRLINMNYQFYVFYNTFIPQCKANNNKQNKNLEVHKVII